jgi:hypothetical protein
MQYHISREGQTYGPYTLEDLQRYVASGNVLLTDMARTEDGAEWVPVSQVIGAAPAGSTAPAGLPVVYSAAAVPGVTTAGGVYPDPPNLHWALVLLIGFFTCGLFWIVWLFVQAAWMRKVNPKSNAIFFYIAYVVISFGGSFLRVGLMAASGFHNRYMGIGIPLSVIAWVLVELGFFDMRRSMEEHFNGPEPIGLSLSGVMTFFFGTFYFQYHMSRINEMKRMARYRGAAI